MYLFSLFHFLCEFSSVCCCCCCACTWKCCAHVVENIQDKICKVLHRIWSAGALKTLAQFPSFFPQTVKVLQSRKSRGAFRQTGKEGGCTVFIRAKNSSLLYGERGSPLGSPQQFCQLYSLEFAYVQNFFIEWKAKCFGNFIFQRLVF